MTRSETLPAIMVQQLRDSAKAAVQDLSKGVVPIVLALALLTPAYLVGRKVEAVQQTQVTTTEAMTRLSSELEKLSPLVHDVATAQARIELHSRALELAERDYKLLETRLKNLEIEAAARELAGR